MSKLAADVDSAMGAGSGEAWRDFFLMAVRYGGPVKHRNL